MSQVRSNPKKGRSPYPFPTHIPTSPQRAAYRIYNFLDNRLWPVRPLYFTASTIGVVGYHLKFPQNVVIKTLPSFDIEFLEWLKIGLVSTVSVYVPVVILRQFLKRTLFSYRGYLYESPKKPSWRTKCWALLRKVLSLSPPLLLSCDLLLPSPSCPDLDETVQKYLDSVKPLLPENEFSVVSELAHDFLNKEGRKLQNLARIKSYLNDNYITGFWEKYAYLYGRSPLPINSSIANTTAKDLPPATVPVRIAHLIYINLMAHLAFDRQTANAPGGGMICTRHFNNLYAIARVPGEKCDSWKRYGISKHGILMYKGGIYRVQVCDDRNKIYTIDELTKIIAELFSREDTRVTGPAAHVPALTTDKRDLWAKNRDRFFLQNRVNGASLHEIESAIICVIYDENTDYGYDPSNPDVYTKFLGNMLFGHNAWMDKSFNYSVAANAKTGCLGEHSFADGVEYDVIVEDYCKMEGEVLSYPPLEQQHKVMEISEDEKRKLKLVQKLPFEINSEMSNEIERCRAAHQTAVNDVDFAATVFRDFGKGLLKKCGVSPDAFVQMALQLANYMDQGHFVLTYEPASVRQFKYSRTETLRTVSEESCAFVKAMQDTNMTKGSRRALLKTACKKHSKTNKECMVGRGIDRHLFVLYILSKGTGISSPFLDHYIAQQWLLSTSHAPNMTNSVDEDANMESMWMGGAFGAVAKTGYGVCYRFGGNHCILAHISSYHSAENTNSARFRSHMEAAFKEMAALFA